MLKKETVESSSNNLADAPEVETLRTAQDGDALSDDQLDAVSGGLVCRKAGKDQQEYMADGSSIIGVL
jgi:hypothetical protein